MDSQAVDVQEAKFLEQLRQYLADNGDPNGLLAKAVDLYTKIIHAGEHK